MQCPKINKPISIITNEKKNKKSNKTFSVNDLLFSFYIENKFIYLYRAIEPHN